MSQGLFTQKHTFMYRNNNILVKQNVLEKRVMWDESDVKRRYNDD